MRKQQRPADENRHERAEVARLIAERTRADAEEYRNTMEDRRQVAEDLRQTAEDLRNTTREAERRALCSWRAGYVALRSA